MISKWSTADVALVAMNVTSCLGRVPAWLQRKRSSWRLKVTQKTNPMAVVKSVENSDTNTTAASACQAGRQVRTPPRCWVEGGAYPIHSIPTYLCPFPEAMKN